jgi:endonuclease YncB( thermonuclease family)
VRLARWLLAALAFASVAHGSAADEDFTGTVTRVFDGDSFLVRPPGRKDIDVRLLDIDAPEKNQPHGAQSRAALVRLIGNRQVRVDVVDTDKYGRKVARVYREPDGLEIARALVHDGDAWVYRRTVHDRAMVALEDEARAKQLGLWSLPEAQRMPPWKFRYLERQRHQQH